MNVGLSSPRFEKYALLYASSESLRKELCNYYSVVINLSTKAVLFVQKPLVKQIPISLRKPFQDEFGTLQKDLIRLATTVNEEVSLAARLQQNSDSVENAKERKESALFRASGRVFRKQTADELVKARKWRESRIKSRFLNSCSRYNFETALNQARKKGSSTWIFGTDEFKKWLSQTSSSSLLCSGIVGAGKSVVCANVIERLTLEKTSTSSIVYFFCRHDDIESLKAREIIGSLARQLFNDVSASVFQEMDPSVGDIPFNQDQIVAQILHYLPRDKKYVIVLDGSDECDFAEAASLVESLQRLLKCDTHTFLLFWTCRSSTKSELSNKFHSETQIRISPSNNGNEISQYIDQALKDAVESDRLRPGDPRIIPKIQDALKREAKEM